MTILLNPNAKEAILHTNLSELLTITEMTGSNKPKITLTEKSLHTATTYSCIPFSEMKIPESVSFQTRNVNQKTTNDSHYVTSSIITWGEHSISSEANRKPTKLNKQYEFITNWSEEATNNSISSNTSDRGSYVGD